MQNKVYPPDHQWTILDVINWTASYFSSHEIDSPRAAAEIVLAHTLGLDRLNLYLQYDQPLSADELARFKTLIKRRVDREPVAYIVGKKEFWSLDLMVSGECLIPRPETECLVEKALTFLPKKNPHGQEIKPMNVLELGTGSGAIICALASERPEHRFFAMDRSVEALLLAARNAKCLKLQNNIQFFAGSWMAAVKTSSAFDMIVSNPPYIPSDTIPTLQPEICRYEPDMALDGGKDGYSCIRRIIASAHVCLKTGGLLILEIGHDQGKGVQKMAKESGKYEDVRVSKDYSRYDRVVEMKKK